jgi:hypothetical protein
MTGATSIQKSVSITSWEILRQASEKRRFLGQLVECSVNQIHTQNANGYLLKYVRRSPAFLQQNLVSGAAMPGLEPQAYPSMRFIGSGVVSGRDCIDKEEKRVVASRVSCDRYAAQGDRV